MNADQILSEIREANLTYLTLAQNVIRVDGAAAADRLGVTAEAASMISLLSPAQMIRIASGNTLLCRLTMTDDIVFDLLTNHGKRSANDEAARNSVRALTREAA